MTKIVTAEEMARIEKLAYSEGASEKEFMEKAGEGIAAEVEEFITSHLLDKVVTLFVGKGNNGGDAYAAGKKLLPKGYQVVAVHFFPLESCSPLCKTQCEEFRKAGGEIHFLKRGEEAKEHARGVILDGLVGTGFHGKAEGDLAEAIVAANKSGLPILAIDIPSGLSGSTGEVGSVAISATLTLSLGLPKIGFFRGEGWNHLGELRQIDFGLSKKYIDAAKAEAHLPQEEEVVSLLPAIRRNRHKYQAGYLVAVAGSPGMCGAAFMAAKAALRMGAGVVRLFHAWEVEGELGAAPLEVVKEAVDPGKVDRIVTEGHRAKAYLIGPGMGRDNDAQKLLRKLLPTIKIPTIFDADALFLFAQNPLWSIPPSSILTPHRKEMERLLQLQQCEEKELHSLCQRFADEKNVTLLLKGGPTFLFHPQTLPQIITHGDPGMATAGTGDVLAGILGGLLAQGLKPQAAALLGATLHGLAGEIAAFQKTSLGLIASDLIEFLPDAIAGLSASAP